MEESRKSFILGVVVGWMAAAAVRLPFAGGSPATTQPMPAGQTLSFSPAILSRLGQEVGARRAQEGWATSAFYAENFKPLALTGTFAKVLGALNYVDALATAEVMIQE